MGRPDDQAAVMPKAAMDRLMPLHLVLNARGQITSCGPTLTKLLDGAPMLGRTLFDAFDLRRPAGLTTMADLRAHTGEKLRLSLRSAAKPVAFRGIAQSLGDGQDMIVNLSFGIGVVDALRSLSLTEGDFAPTDLAVEMLYLVEAKAAAMAGLRELAQRLTDDKQLAQQQALTDTLTGLRNRRALTLVLEGLARTQTPFALMHVDLDFFKAVNDTLGHAAGDHVLRVVASILLSKTRTEDTVARVGGDEFVLVFPDLTEAAHLEGIARRIIDHLSDPIDFEGKACRISASIGIVSSDQYAEPNSEKMQSDADEALYASKRGGRSQARVFQPAKADRRSA